jgi:hypothetical protein
MKSSATQHRPGRGGATPIMRRKRLSPCASFCDTIHSPTQWFAFCLILRKSPSVTGFMTDNPMPEGRNS